MVGETIKLGFDGTSVKRGLANVMGGFSKLGRGIGRATRQVGIGAARRMGSDLFGMIVQAGKAIPNEIQNLSALNKEMKTIAESTGLATDKYLALREAIAKATGRDSEGAGDFMRDISERVGEALTDPESGPRQAMRAMRIKPNDLKDQNPLEQMKVIAKGFRDFQASHGKAKAMFEINKMLGGEGRAMASLFMDFDKHMENASALTKNVHGDMVKLDDALESVFDIKSAMRLKFAEMAMGAVKALRAVNIEGQGIAEWIRGIDMSGKMDGFANMIKTNLEQIKKVGVFKWLQGKIGELGKWISQVIADGIKSGTAWFSDQITQIADMMSARIEEAITNGLDKASEKIQSVIPGGGGVLKWLTSPAEPQKHVDENGQTIANNTTETNRILNRIATNSVARYA